MINSSQRNIVIAIFSDIDAPTQVEIESKKKSIPECIDEIGIDHSARLHRWQTYFRGESPQTSKLRE